MRENRAINYPQVRIASVDIPRFAIFPLGFGGKHAL